MPYFLYTGDVRRRRMNKSTSRTGSRFGAFSPSNLREHRCGIQAGQRCAPSAAIGSEYPRGSFDLSDDTRTKINQVQLPHLRKSEPFNIQSSIIFEQYVKLLVISGISVGRGTHRPFLGLN